jgi:DNA helicase-2/ATP-dependent DNA helicase PcrA
LKLRNHFYNNDFAILYRTNAQSRSFEESLRRMGIVYKIYGGMSFYQRKEVKDFIAYLRLVVNPKDEEAIKRVINYPVRGIGKTTIDRLVLIANNNNSSVWDILTNAAFHGFKSGTLECIDTFVTMIKMFQSELVKKNAYDLSVIIGKSTNIVKELFNDKTTEGLARYENVQELLNSIKEFTETPMNIEDGEVGDKSLGTYLQQIALLTDTEDNKQKDGSNGTLHRRKDKGRVKEIANHPPVIEHLNSAAWVLAQTGFKNEREQARTDLLIHGMTHFAQKLVTQIFQQFHRRIGQQHRQNQDHAG